MNSISAITVTRTRLHSMGI